MPLSRKRKKNGKRVGRGERKNFEAHNKRLANMESGLTIQDLINVVAYQDGVQDGTIVADDVIVTMGDDIPVFVGEGENRREIGTASPNKDDPERVSIHITDPGAAQIISGPTGNYSIDKENEDGQ